MRNSGRKSKTGASPRQLALVAVLAVIFVIVLIVQFGGSSDARETPKSEGAADRPSQTAGAEEGPAAASAQESAAPPQPADQEWPILQPDDVLRYDPFATPAAFALPNEAGQPTPDLPPGAQALSQQAQAALKKAEQERTLTRLRQEGVKTIVGSRDQGRVAVIGTRTIHVGDLVDGFRVIAIEPDGVVVQYPASE